MTAQVDLFGAPTKADPHTRASRPTLRRRDIDGARTVRTNYGTYTVIAVNSDRTVTIADPNHPGHVPHVIPFSHVEGVTR